MRSDIDTLLQERGLDALVVTGPDGLAESNAPFRYFVGGAHVTGMVIKVRGRRPVLLHSDIERDAARSTGLETVSSSRWPLKEIFSSFPTHIEARVELYRRVFHDLGVSGRVAVTGVDEVANALAFWSRLREALPELEVVAETDGTILEDARMTKDAEELEALDRAGRDTCRIVGEVRARLAAARVTDDGLEDADGPLTIGTLKRLVGDRMHAARLTAPDGFILSANRDAAIPHNVGDPDHRFRPGDVVLFDFFPRASSGYYHDVTRTWTLGPARAEVRQAFEDVQSCFDHVMGRIVPGASTRGLQLETCAFLEERGHATTRQDPASTSGFVHSLGHGLGLDVHEKPNFPTFRAGRDTELRPGMVVTVEPAVYYPERGFGIRLEDSVVVTDIGARSLSPAPLDLEIPLAATDEPTATASHPRRVRNG